MRSGIQKQVVSGTDLRSLQVENHARLGCEVRVVPELLDITVLVRGVREERPLKLLPFPAGLELRASKKVTIVVTNIQQMVETRRLKRGGRTTRIASRSLLSMEFREQYAAAARKVTSLKGAGRDLNRSTSRRSFRDDAATAKLSTMVSIFFNQGARLLLVPPLGRWSKYNVFRLACAQEHPFQHNREQAVELYNHVFYHQYAVDIYENSHQYVGKAPPHLLDHVLGHRKRLRREQRRHGP